MLGYNFPLKAEGSGGGGERNRGGRKGITADLLLSLFLEETRHTFNTMSLITVSSQLAGWLTAAFTSFSSSHSPSNDVNSLLIIMFSLPDKGSGPMCVI